jgi:hypothetical protein
MATRPLPPANSLSLRVAGEREDERPQEAVGQVRRDPLGDREQRTGRRRRAGLADGDRGRSTMRFARYSVGAGRRG